MGSRPTIWGGVCRLGGSIGLALVALAACGDDSSDAETFCEEGRAAFDSFHVWLEGDLARDELDQVVDAMGPVSAPAAISEEWSAMVEALEEWRDADPGDPAAVSEATDGVLQLSDELRQIDDYVRGSC